MELKSNNQTNNQGIKQTNLRGTKQSIKQPNYQIKQTKDQSEKRELKLKQRHKGKQSQLLLKPTEVELGLQVGVEFDNFPVFLIMMPPLRHNLDTLKTPIMYHMDTLHKTYKQPANILQTLSRHPPDYGYPPDTNRKAGPVFLIEVR